MKQLGMTQIDIPATEVIIKSEDKEIVITNPQVSKVNMMGQETYQIVGQAHEREKTSEVQISEEDVQTIVAQTGVSEAAAREALKKTGDLAEAIIQLQDE